MKSSSFHKTNNNYSSFYNKFKFETMGVHTYLEFIYSYLKFIYSKSPLDNNSEIIDENYIIEKFHPEKSIDYMGSALLHKYIGEIKSDEEYKKFKKYFLWNEFINLYFDDQNNENEFVPEVLKNRLSTIEELRKNDLLIENFINSYDIINIREIQFEYRRFRDLFLAQYYFNSRNRTILRFTEEELQTGFPNLENNLRLFSKNKLAKEGNNLLLPLSEFTIGELIIVLGDDVRSFIKFFETKFKNDFIEFTLANDSSYIYREFKNNTIFQKYEKDYNRYLREVQNNDFFMSEIRKEIAKYLKNHDEKFAQKITSLDAYQQWIDKYQNRNPNIIIDNFIKDDHNEWSKKYEQDLNNKYDYNKFLGKARLIQYYTPDGKEGIPVFLFDIEKKMYYISGIIYLKDPIFTNCKGFRLNQIPLHYSTDINSTVYVVIRDYKVELFEVEDGNKLRIYQELEFLKIADYESYFKKKSLEQILITNDQLVNENTLKELHQSGNLSPTILAILTKSALNEGQKSNLKDDKNKKKDQFDKASCNECTKLKEQLSNERISLTLAQQALQRNKAMIETFFHIYEKQKDGFYPEEKAEKERNAYIKEFQEKPQKIDYKNTNSPLIKKKE